MLLRIFVIGLLFLTNISYAENKVEKGIYDSCDATAKILVKCMIAKNCDIEAGKLQKALSGVSTLKERDKQLLVSDCYRECQKGKLLKTKEELQSAVNGEYNAVMNNCINYMTSLVKESEEN